MLLVCAFIYLTAAAEEVCANGFPTDVREEVCANPCCGNLLRGGICPLGTDLLRVLYSQPTLFGETRFLAFRTDAFATCRPNGRQGIDYGFDYYLVR